MKLKSTTYSVNHVASRDAVYGKLYKTTSQTIINTFNNIVFVYIVLSPHAYTLRKDFKIRYAEAISFKGIFTCVLYT